MLQVSRIVPIWTDFVIVCQEFLEPVFLMTKKTNLLGGGKMPDKVVPRWLNFQMFPFFQGSGGGDPTEMPNRRFRVSRVCQRPPD